MKVNHRISLNASAGDVQELANFGITIKEGFVSIDVSEDHHEWNDLHTWIDRRQPVDIVSTQFTKQELSDAKWLTVTPGWHHGYPQPNELDFGYRTATYDCSDYCDQCGIGLHQRAAFQMKQEPVWGKNGIMQLNWVFDEYFVRLDLWEEVFQQYGVGKRPVENTKGKQLSSVVQLVIDEEVSINVDDLYQDGCNKCSRTKYSPVTRGYFPKLEGIPVGHMVRTRQYFGSGASASKSILVSQMLAQELLRHKVKGISFIPVL